MRLELIMPDDFDGIYVIRNRGQNMAICCCRGILGIGSQRFAICMAIAVLMLSGL
jgi:hypothetical protein